MYPTTKEIERHISSVLNVLILDESKLLKFVINLFFLNGSITKKKTKLEILSILNYISAV